MAAKKIKEQEAKAPETSAPENQAGKEPDTEPAPSAEDGKDTEQNLSAEDEGDAGQDTETGENATEKPLPKVLTALRPILYLAKQYKAGESLPVNDPEMVAAWIEARSAQWQEKKGGRFFP